MNFSRLFDVVVFCNREFLSNVLDTRLTLTQNVLETLQNSEGD
jgi:hypothetical protein